jgi:hypothetical protein
MNRIEKNVIPQERSKRQIWKYLQTRLVWRTCSWMVLGRASYRPHALTYTVTEVTLVRWLHGTGWKLWQTSALQWESFWHLSVYALLLNRKEKLFKLKKNTHRNITFIWSPLGLLAARYCCRVVWGLRSLNAAFPCWSCISYFIPLSIF